MKKRYKKKKSRSESCFNGYRIDPKLKEPLLNEVSQIDKSNKKRKILYWVITVCVMVFISLVITAFLLPFWMFNVKSAPSPVNGSYTKRNTLEKEIIDQIRVVNLEMASMTADSFQNDSTLFTSYNESVKTIIDSWLADYSLFIYDNTFSFPKEVRSRHYLQGKRVDSFLIRDSVFHESIASVIHILKKLVKQNSNVTTDENDNINNINKRIFEIIKKYLSFKDKHNYRISKLKNYLNSINNSSELDKRCDDSTGIDSKQTAEQLDYINSLAENIQLNNIVYELLFTCNMVNTLYLDLSQEQIE